MAGPPANAGTVTGTVKDATGAVIPGATVTLTGEDGKTQQVQTGQDGAYTFRGGHPGHLLGFGSRPGPGAERRRGGIGERRANRARRRCP